MSNVNSVELTWLLLSLVGWLIAADNLRDSYIEWRIMRGSRTDDLLGVARGVVSRANTRREAVRLVIQSGFLVLVVPALLRPGDTPFSWWIAILISFPMLMALNSYLDRRVRRALAAMDL